MNTIAFILWIFGCVVCGCFLAFLSLRVLNGLPAKWLCDYGEEPDEELLSKERFHIKPYGIILAASLILSFVLCFLQYGTGITFFCVCAESALLILIALCDAKYTVIPDQFTLFLLVPSLVSACNDLFWGGKVFHTHILLPLLGAVCGGAIMLLLSLLGKIIYKKEALGFGDVKLFAMLGFFAGPVQILLVFLMTVLLAGFHFAYLILRKKIDGSRYLPFGPYICTAFLLFLAFHIQIDTGVAWYLSLLR
jgi:prepilin signal peptidase PulO-like enzyme (type II secretory pathway)